MSNVITFEHVCYAYPEADDYALKNVSFEVREGGTEVILGGSGSGKSTILKLILGLIKPESGSINVEGFDIIGMKERELMQVRAKIGMVFQEGALFDSLTVAENVGFRLREQGDYAEDEIEARARRILGFVELEEFFDRMPSDLSGGQRRRVAVARAMAHQPELILYDEATTGLDPITAATVCNLMVKLRDLEGVTTVFVTHQLRDAFQVAESSVVEQDGKITYPRIEDPARLARTEFLMLNRGELVFRGQRGELTESSHPYVQSFMA